MKRFLTMLVAGLALVPAAGVGTAWAGGPAGGAPVDQAQAIDQSQQATNAIDQTANANSVAVNASPNIAVANGGSVDQSSDASSGAVAANQNESQQKNTLTNDAAQSQGSTSPQDGNASQSIDQSQNAGNSVSQNAEAKSAAVNASPNVAVLDKGDGCKCGGGDVKQSSRASSRSLAVNKNESEQKNRLENEAGQSQTGRKGSDSSQSTKQDQQGANSIEQNAKAGSVAVNASPNVAIANSGSVKQRSNASSRAAAGNENESGQSNSLTNEAAQSQGGVKSCGCDSNHESAPRSQGVDQRQDAANSISQNAAAKSLALDASPNLAVLNSGRVGQQSDASSKAVAVNENRSSQSNSLGQGARQRQSQHGKHGRRGGDCKPKCSDRCKRDECRKHDRCERSRCERRCD